MRHPTRHQTEQSVIARKSSSLDVSQATIKIKRRKQCRKAPRPLGRNPVAPASRRLSRGRLGLAPDSNRSPSLIHQPLEVNAPLGSAHVGTVAFGRPIERNSTFG